jgi:integrase
MRLNHITAEDVDALPLPGGPYNINCPLRVFFIPDSKTDNGRRFVPISDRALELLKARCGERREGWVFTAFSASGHLTTMGRKFREARREAGLPEKLVLYCGRHDYGTRVLQGTGNLAVVMRAVGHGSPSMAMKYQHPELEQVRRALNGTKSSHHPEQGL